MSSYSPPRYGILRRWVEDEKNIRIREREEQRYKHMLDILTGIILGGSLVAGASNLIQLIQLIIIAVIIIVLFIVTNAYLQSYSDYTNVLIRQEEKPVSRRRTGRGKHDKEDDD